MHEVLANRLGGLSLPRKSVVRLTDRPDMTLDVYRGRKKIQQYNNNNNHTTWVTRPCDRIIENHIGPYVLCVCNNDNGYIYVSLNSANTDQTAVMSSPVRISIWNKNSLREDQLDGNDWGVQMFRTICPTNM